MQKRIGALTSIIALWVALAGPATEPVSKQTMDSISTPDRVATGLGTLEFKDGAPSAATVQKVYDNLDLMRGVDAFMYSFSGASAYASARASRVSGLRIIR